MEKRVIGQYARVCLTQDFILNEALSKDVRCSVVGNSKRFQSIDSRRHSDEIPNWIKQYARWWVTDDITNEDFISVISHLVKTGVILNTHQFKILDNQNNDGDFIEVDTNVDPQPQSALKTYVKGWSEGTISDSEFFNAIKYLIDDDESLKSTFTIDTTNSTEIPDWIKQYARWLVSDDITEENFISILGHLVKTGVIVN